MPKKGEYVTLKNFRRKIKSTFMIYADFESILVHENNGKQNPNKSYTWAKRLSKILLAVWTKKVNIIVMWWKNISKRTCDD